MRGLRSFFAVLYALFDGCAWRIVSVAKYREGSYDTWEWERNGGLRVTVYRRSLPAVQRIKQSLDYQTSLRGISFHSCLWANLLA